MSTQDSVRVSSAPAQTGEDVKDSIHTPKSPRKAMLYSALFPGMGQLYNGKKFKALVFFCTEFGLMSNSIYLNQKYVSSTNELDRDFYLNNRNLSTWYLIGAVLFSSIDAFVDAHLSDFDESSDLSLRVNPVQRGNGLMLNVAVNF
ncbi:MAG: DUF5683 domain-containing protein [candidate division KSB1 bacterium]|nr:DUF5683 domain-containing protein [candidate division KSB1 bacterium]